MWLRKYKMAGKNKMRIRDFGAFSKNQSINTDVQMKTESLTSGLNEV